MAQTRTEANIRGTLLVAAVEWYATENDVFPTQLDDLVPNYLETLPVDPFTGESFSYDFTDTDYILYSAGADMEDNGGEIHSRRMAPGTDLVLHGPAREE